MQQGDFVANELKYVGFNRSSYTCKGELAELCFRKDGKVTFQQLLLHTHMFAKCLCLYIKVIPVLCGFRKMWLFGSGNSNFGPSGWFLTY